MNYTKAIEKKIKYRENLLSEYRADIEAAKKLIEAIGAEVKAAEDAGNYKLVAQKERQLRAAGEDLADSEKALEMAIAKERIPLQLIRDEWKNGPRADYLARQAKATAALDKAFKVFSDLAIEAARINEECDIAGDEWKELMFEESGPGASRSSVVLSVDAGVFNPSGIIKDYSVKFDQANPRFNR